MPLDPSIILQGKQAQLENPLEVAGKALTLKHLANQNRLADKEAADKENLSSVLKKYSKVGDDGSVQIDRKGALSELAQNGGGDQLAATDKYINSFQLDQLKAHTDTASALLSGATPQNWPEIQRKGVEMGLPHWDKLPPQVTPEQLNQMITDNLDGKERVAQMWKQKEFDQKKEELEIKHQEIGLKRQEQKGQYNQKLADALKKDLDADAGRTGNFGKISNTVINAEKLQQLTQQHPDGNLDPRQMEEYALGLANMLSGSSGAARSQVEALVPHTIMGNAQKMKEWLLNDPQGAEQQNFVKRMAETVEREKALAEEQLNKVREQRLTSHSKLAKQDPETYKAILKGYGLNPEDYDQNGLRKNKQAPQTNKPSAVPAAAHPMANDAKAWAKANPNDPKAQEILNRLGQ